MPRTSVIIPTYNRAELVREAIDSVLKQTFTDFELIVVDDGSTDNTRQAIASITDSRLKYLRQPNGGVSKARNAGVEIARGEYVAFLDSDDLFLPEKLFMQVEMIDGKPSIGLVYSFYYAIKEDGEGRKLRGKCYAPRARHLPLGPTIHLSTVLIRRSWLEDVGGFDEDLAVFEDRDLTWRLGATGCKMVCIPKPLTIRRKHEVGLTRDFHRYEADMIAYVHKVFGDPRMPAEFLEQKDSILASQFVNIAATAYLAMEPDAGRDMLERAIATDPTLAGENIGSLVKHFVNFILGHSVGEPKDVLRLIRRHPPGGKVFAVRFWRLSWHEFHINATFKAYEAGELSKCRKHAMMTIVHKPSSIRNRGLLSILVRSIIGNRVFNSLKLKVER